MARDDEPGMGKAKGTKNAKSKWTKYTPTASTKACFWEEISAPLIGELVGCVTRDGDAILLGTTRDGGAFAITVCSGDERIKFYARSSDELAKIITDLIQTSND